MDGEFTIKNRRNETLALSVERADAPRGLVFIMHGFAGFRRQKHIRAFAEAFLQENFTVVSFDVTHANGESDGETKYATMNTYVHDLEDVVSWAKQQPWFRVPFALCGHSMGAQSVAWYASQHPEEVSLLLPMAPMVNYELRMNVVTENQKKLIDENGFVELPSKSKPGVVNIFTRDNHESLRGYDLLKVAPNITMPVLDIVGEQDEPCPVAHQKQFIQAIASQDKMLITVPSVDHNYRAEGINYDTTLNHISSSIRDWVSKHI